MSVLVIFFGKIACLFVVVAVVVVVVVSVPHDTLAQV